MPVLERSTGNAEVIGLFEYWLDLAREGDVNFAAVSAVKGHDQVSYDYAGAAGLEDRAQHCMVECAQELGAIVEGRRRGPRNYNLDASYIEWDCVGTPVCWDFLIWLVDAEMTRRRLKCLLPSLRIHFSRVDELDKVSRDFFENVFRPLLPLIGAVEDVNAKGGRHKPLYVPYDIVIASKAGEEVPRLKASDRARDAMAGWLHDTVPVTVTLREAPHWRKRNSNLDAWLKFADDLQRKGEDVIFIRDTFKATEPLPGFVTCPIAAWNVDLRMALYERAKCNMFISNGPAGLGLFSDRPYLYFVNINRSVDYAANNPGWWRKSNGVAEGEQWPWALTTQKMIWKTDTYENISEAWEDLQCTF